MEAVQGIYRQRNPRASPLYRLVAEHFDALKACYSERFERDYGPWQSQWDVVVEKFLSCGDLFYGFARLYCDSCRYSGLRAFSCEARDFCPSCEAKRRALWAEHVIHDVLPADVAYRMGVFTMPKCLRPIFLRDRSRIGAFSRKAYECVRTFLSDQFPGVEGVPYFVSVVQHFGDQANAHLHLHTLFSLGIKAADGTFHHAPQNLDFSPLEEMFRRGVVTMLARKKLLSKEFRDTLLSWEHSGFSVHSDVGAPKGAQEDLERLACYLLRPALSLQRLTYKSGSSSAVYQGKWNPSTKSNFQVFDAKRFLLNLLCLLPRRYEAVIRYYGAASSTARRGQAAATLPEVQDSEDEYHEDEPVLNEEPVRRDDSRRHDSKPSTWARLLAMIYRVDPLKCPRCGHRLRVISVITDPEVVEKILRHTRHWNPPRGPP